MINRTLNELKLEKHPGKTLIGRKERGLGFLSYHFKPKGIGLAQKTITNLGGWLNGKIFVRLRIEPLESQGKSVNAPCFKGTCGHARILVLANS